MAFVKRCAYCPHGGDEPLIVACWLEQLELIVAQELYVELGSSYGRMGRNTEEESTLPKRGKAHKLFKKTGPPRKSEILQV
jgi:hypothetical protein